MPALRKAKDQAKRIHCGGSIRQLNLAAIMYSEDNRGVFPPGQAVYGRSWGIYPVWLRTKTDSGGFIAHGILFEQGIISEPKLYYCPGNMNLALKYGYYDPAKGGGGWPKGSIPGDVPETQQLVWSTFHNRSLWTGSQWRALNSNKDRGGTAIFADVFTDPSRGVELHHKSGYNVGYMDGHVSFVKDTEREIEGLKGGEAYHTDYGVHDYVWKEFFDEGSRRYSIQENVMDRITID